MRFHLLGLAHVPLKWDECLCPFTTLAYNMAKMIKRAGHELTVYAPERSEVECDEFVPVVAWSTLEKTSDIQGTFRFRWHNNMEDLAWKEHVDRAACELAKRYRPLDIVLPAFGWFQKYATTPGRIVVEFACGYSGIWLPNYHVFPSYAWFHHINGTLKRETDPSWYDVVIPHYLDMDRWPLVEKKENYLAYIGRLDPIKGVDIAADVAHAAGLELRVAGRYANEEKLPPWLEGRSHVKYMGALRHADRVKLIANARATMCVSRWIEAFGMTTIESHACGTPVISSDFGAHTETNIEGVAGFRCRDFDDMVMAVRRTSELDPARIRQTATDRYSLDAVWPQYERYFERLVRHWTGGRGWYSTKSTFLSDGTEFGDTWDAATLACGHSPNQLPSESSELWGLIRDAQPDSYLEVGCEYGGHALLMSRALKAGARIVLVDLPGGQGGSGSSANLRGVADKLMGSGFDVRLILGDSHSPDIVQQVRAAALDAGFGAAFIDGDHSEAGAQADVDNFLPMVKAGGIFAIHDITGKDRDVAVQSVWERLRDSLPSCATTIAHAAAYGIGVIRVPLPRAQTLPNAKSEAGE